MKRRSSSPYLSGTLASSMLSSEKMLQLLSPQLRLSTDLTKITQLSSNSTTRMSATAKKDWRPFNSTFWAMILPMKSVLAHNSECHTPLDSHWMTLKCWRRLSRLESRLICLRMKTRQLSRLRKKMSPWQKKSEDKNVKYQDKNQLGR